MSTFPFHPELFAERGRAMNALADLDLLWFSSYRSIDIEHELYGLEVCGIRDQETAETVAMALRRTFPEWRNGYMYERSYADGDPGWTVVICREGPEATGDNTKAAPPDEAECSEEDERALEELRALLDADLGLDNDTTGETESPAENADEGESERDQASPLVPSLRREALGDALRQAGDDRGAAREYLMASLLGTGTSIPQFDPAQRFWQLLLSLKSAAVIERLGDSGLADRHRRLAHLELSALVDDPPARSFPVPCAGTPPADGSNRSLTGLQLGHPGGLDPVRFASILDAETGLLNRRGLEGVLARQAADGQGRASIYTLVILQIANQSMIAEGRGVDGLAATVRETARRLLALFHGAGLLVRWGPAALGVLRVAPDPRSGTAANHVTLQRVHEAFPRPVILATDGTVVRVRVIAGTSLAAGSQRARDCLAELAEADLERARKQDALE